MRSVLLAVSFAVVLLTTSATVAENESSASRSKCKDASFISLVQKAFGQNMVIERAWATFCEEYQLARSQSSESVAMLKRTNDALGRLEARLSELGENLDGETKKREGAVGSLGGEISDLWHLVPRGAIVAFNRPCEQLPGDGWEYFEDAGGRFIVGAGKHDNTFKDVNTGETKDLAIYDEPGKTGGEQDHVPTESEVARHSHGLKSFTGDYRTGSGATNGIEIKGGNAFGIEQPEDETGTEILKPVGVTELGGGKDGVTEAHNNMPPYIALYFCRRG